MSITNVTLSGQVVEVNFNDKSATLTFIPDGEVEVECYAEVYGKLMELLPEDVTKFQATLSGTMRLVKDEDGLPVPHINVLHILKGGKGFSSITIDGTASFFRAKTAGKLELIEFAIGCPDYNPDTKKSEYSNYKAVAKFQIEKRMAKMDLDENTKTKMTVFGKLSFNEWEDKDGNTKRAVQVDIVEFNCPPTESNNSSASKTTKSSNKKSSKRMAVDDDDVF